MAEARIDLADVSVEFPIYDAQSRSLKRSLLQLSTGGLLKFGRNNTVLVRALNNVTFQFRRGDRIALLGHNGAGKTTLLRVIAGAYEPTSGLVSTQGTIGALFDLLLGMDPEATGAENILIRGLLLGLTVERIDELRADIVAFSELGSYIDLPVRTYSSGMLLRLAFAICTSIETDILLMDEWFAVGDEAFLRKAEQRLDAMIARSGIFVFASHSLELMRRTCGKAIWLEHGRVVMDGPFEAVAQAYLAGASQRQKQDEAKGSPTGSSAGTAG